MRTETKQYLKNMGMQTAAGGSAGFVEVCLMYPLDIVKTRLQIQAKKTASTDPQKYYNGVMDCIRKMYKHEGFLSYYKGILPPILAETPKRATKFLTFEQYKQFFMFGSPTPTAWTYSLAGMGAGVTEAILVNPFEVIKVSLQSNNSSNIKEVPSTWQVTRSIIKSQGIGFRGLNKGVDATIWRNAVFNAIYFGFYNSVKENFPQRESPLEEFSRKLAIGFASGVMGSVANIPFDVAKSRIQGPQPILGQIKYRSTFPTIILVYREEGFKALYKGLVPKVLRLGPGCAIMMVVYEYLYDFLKEKFP
ncbi:mitochondrial 2-oxodicarboxylate carrier [Chrysoperla carnea]|uniref:mitochondrial 2-oxodicarboxylate carrier n=1 Tax=Chrysoperla carnea TaxID=189513 RepID=UPI001D07224A|nr:mitochondrial 2-oxodicarboxylate carrier [Chrysoperla carnea]XP_044731164.1 mitochondrial 2-oxodicarboxylate carrier [Chrysoperla carnea]